MRPAHLYVLALERDAQLRDEADRERLRRAAIGATPSAPARRRPGFRIHLRWPRPWAQRPAG